MNLQTMTGHEANDCAATETQPLMLVTGLKVATNGGKQIIRGVDLTINRGEVVALVGESGSGKSVTALALSHLLPRGLRVSEGSIRLAGQETVGLKESEVNAMRGAQMSMIFQQPQAMLDPTSRVRSQVAEPLWRKEGLRGRRSYGRVIELLRNVGIPDPEARSKAYSYELSGGMAQRVMMACAMAGSPRLLIADEPTTALDVTVQAQILRLLRDERDRHDLSILLITHDLSVVAAFADRVAVMYAGRIVEEGVASEVMARPAHPYTRALIRCSLLEPEPDGRLLSISGSSAQALSLREGCRFAPRCTAMHDATVAHDCTSREPELAVVSGGSRSRCHLVGHEGAAT